jgi:hypothetical protein
LEKVAAHVEEADTFAEKVAAHVEMEVGCKVPRIAIEDVKDAEKEHATSSIQEVLLARSLLPQRHDDYHT